MPGVQVFCFVPKIGLVQQKKHLRRKSGSEQGGLARVAAGKCEGAGMVFDYSMHESQGKARFANQV